MHTDKTMYYYWIELYCIGPIVTSSKHINVCAIGASIFAAFPGKTWQTRMGGTDERRHTHTHSNAVCLVYFIVFTTGPYTLAD